MKNAVREIEYTEDGCYLFECLWCHAQWEARTKGFRFCPHCGIEWAERVSSDNIRYKRSKFRQATKNSTCPKWQIQSRYMCSFSDGKWGDWEDWGDPYKASAKQVYACLESQRQRHAPSKNHPDEKWEWRAILVS